MNLGDAGGDVNDTSCAKICSLIPAPQTGRRHENSDPATADVLASHCRRADVIRGHNIIFHQEHFATAAETYRSGNRYNSRLSRKKYEN